MDNVVRDDLSRRVANYNATVKRVLASVNEANAKVEYSKKEFEKGCEQLSKELGREVNASNLEEVYKELEDSIVEQVNLGEQLIARANAQLNENKGSSAPVVSEEVSGNSNAYSDGSQLNNGMPQPMGSAPVNNGYAPANNIGNFGNAGMGMGTVPQMGMGAMPSMGQQPMAGYSGMNGMGSMPQNMMQQEAVPNTVLGLDSFGSMGNGLTI